MTEWKRVERNTKYEVSDAGQVRNVKTGRVLRPCRVSSGYLAINLGRRVTVSVHRLVAEAFLPPVCGGSHVNHIDGDKGNNVLSNLEWCSQQENNIHARRVLGKCLGEEHGLSKLTWDKVEDIRSRVGQTAEEIGREFSVTGACIRQIQLGKTWRQRPSHSVPHG